jgi:hypothetical protein
VLTVCRASLVRGIVGVIVSPRSAGVYQPTQPDSRAESRPFESIFHAADEVSLDSQ